MQGKAKVQHSNVEFVSDKNTPPCIEEAESAFQKHNCAILTAFRGTYELNQNIERNNKLKEDMNKANLEYRPVMGCYREAGWEETSYEYCFFITSDDKHTAEEFFSIVFQLSAKYDQDSFLYKRAGINRTAFLIATTDAGREDLKGDIKFAGQLYLRVPDVDAWTDCSNGRIAFQLKGMILIGTGTSKIKIGEGNIFDTEGYDADAICIIRKQSQEDLKDACHNYNGKAQIVERYFMKENQTEEEIHDKVLRALKVLTDKKCKRIGFHCSASIEGSSEKAAKVVIETIKAWAKRRGKKLDWIVLVDIYGDYGKALE